MPCRITMKRKYLVEIQLSISKKDSVTAANKFGRNLLKKSKKWHRKIENRWKKHSIGSRL